MSPLTKVFVLLLVVTSMLTAGAFVVFVNRVDISEKERTETKGKVANLQRDLSAAQVDAAAARGRMAASEALAAQAADAAKAGADKANADLASKNAENLALMRNQATAEANTQGLQAKLAIALEINKKDAETLNAVRDTNSKLVQSQAETDAALARQRQLAETYQRQVEYLTEQVKKLTDENTAMAAALQKANIAVPAAGQVTAAPTGAGAPNVSGVVRDKQNINGVTYLTISVGSADSVQPGMEFSVVDAKAQPPQFLGILTITQADSNSSVGRLQGDDQMVARVKQGNEVTTHLQ